MKTNKPFDTNLTNAEFKSRIIGALRQLSRWWKPKQEAISRARVGRGKYKCELCGEIGPATLPPLPGKKRKRKNIQADHIIPIVGQEGFISYDEWIKRCFVPASGFQAICWECHSKKTKKENTKRRKNKNNTKNMKTIKLLFPLIPPSKAYQKWHKELIQYYNENYSHLDLKGKAFIVTYFFEIPYNKDGTKSGRPFDYSNKIESINDFLVDLGIIDDDNYNIIKEQHIYGMFVESGKGKVTVKLEEVPLDYENTNKNTLLDF